MMIRSGNKHLKFYIFLFIFLCFSTICIAKDNLLNVDKSLIDGINYLTNIQSNNGGWEDNDCVSDNAHAIRAYIATNNTNLVNYHHLVERLKALQAPDGSWNENVYDTSYAILALIESGESKNSTIIQTAISWINNHVSYSDLSKGEPRNVAASLIGLIKSGVPKDTQNITDALAWLKANQNHDGYWGNTAGDPSACYVHGPPVALILAESETTNEAQKALNFLYSNCLNEAYQILTTFEAYAHSSQYSILETVKNKLLSHQMQDYGWNHYLDFPSRNYETALAVTYLAKINYEGVHLTNGFSWIESHISEIGDFTGNYVKVIPTSWALLAISNIIKEKSSVEIIEIDKLQNCSNLARQLLIDSQNNGWAWWSILSKSNSQDTMSTSMAIWALVENNVEVSNFKGAIDSLLSSQNSNGGWGTFCFNGSKDTYTSEVSISNNSLLALLLSGYDLSNPQILKGLEYLVANQTDSHWENVSQTSLAIINFKLSSYNSQLLKNSLAWLKENQNFDGGWGGKKNASSTVSDTALAMIALSACNEKNDILSKALSWLVAAQNPDGGWSNLPGIKSSDTISTAKALISIATTNYTENTFKVDIFTDKAAYCPCDTMDIQFTSNSEIDNISANITDPLKNVTILDLVPVSNFDPKVPIYRASYSNVFPGTYTIFCEANKQDLFTTSAKNISISPLNDSCNFLKGDINNDGKIDLREIIYVLQIMSGL